MSFPSTPESTIDDDRIDVSPVSLLARDASAILAPFYAASETLLGLDAATAHAIHDGVARLGAIVRRLGTIGSAPGPRAIHLNFVVASAVAHSRSLSRHARVVTRLEEPLPPVWVDPLALERALLALLLDRDDDGPPASPIVLTTTSSASDRRVILHIADAVCAPPRLARLRDAVVAVDRDARLESNDDGSRVIVAFREASPLRGAGNDRVGPHVLVFPPFRLDVANESLWRGDTKLYLRAKPFAILRYFAEHPKRLVTHAELTEAAWGKVLRSGSLLRTRVRELRQVLGRGIIETVTGRGYRFAVDVRRRA